MAIEIKNNFGPIIEARENAKVYLSSLDAVKRYEVIRRVLGDNIEDVDFDNLPADKINELMDACSSVSETRKATKSSKPATVKIKKGTFTYIYYDDEQGQIRLRVLFQYLRDSCGWLTKDAGYKEWSELFSGKDREGTLVWTGQQSQLKFLFKYMLEREIVVNKSGLGPFEILGSHFKKPHDILFANWNDIKKPAKRDEKALKEMAKFLDINIEIDLTDSVISTYVKTRGKRY